MTMRQSALLAMRSPPRLRRCRLVLPDEAGTGDTPHKLANAASERRRSGLSPAATKSAPATSGPTPVRYAQRGCGFHGQAAELTVQHDELRGQPLMTDRQRAERQLTCRARCRDASRPRSCSDGDQLIEGKIAKLMAERVWSGDHQRSHLVPHLGSHLDRGATCDPEGADHADPVVVTLGDAERTTSQHRSRCCFGVDRI